ncbi:MAG TPA: protein-glutamate O-methyltransferase CheR [Hyphomicrobium sp.]|nr:protein-glutamate O-methyltransferase CheR [Hyphomicrobium sp.]
MDDSDLAFLQGFLARTSGMALWSEKRYLADARLEPLAKRLGLEGLPALIAKLKRRNDPALDQMVMAAMTTNDTSFFRDRKPFEQFETVMLPALIARRAATRRLRIWCSAVSSGQEAYSLAMMLADHAQDLEGWRIDLVGTDLSKDVLATAAQGRYTHFEVQRGVPVRLLLQHFRPEGTEWQISDAIRRAVDFRILNLNDEYPAVGPFDVIFCRNVLLYFEQSRRGDALDRVVTQLADDGFLVLGATESLIGLTAKVASDPDNRGIYMRPQFLRSARSQQPPSALAPR